MKRSGINPRLLCGMNNDLVEIATPQFLEPLVGVERQCRVEPELHGSDHFLLCRPAVFNCPRFESPLLDGNPGCLGQIVVIALQNAHLADRAIEIDREPDPDITDDPGPLQGDRVNRPGVAFGYQKKTPPPLPRQIAPTSPTTQTTA